MINEKVFLKPDFCLSYSNVICGFTLPYFGNQALTRNSISSKMSTKQNRMKLAEFLQISNLNIFSPHQIHSDVIIEVEHNLLGSGAYSLENAIEGDACITNMKNVLLITTFADCIPVLLYDYKEKWIASIHSGWKGTIKNISEKTVSALLRKNCNLNNIYASIGPGISNCCYKVGHEFAEIFTEIGMNDYLYTKEEQLFLDLAGCVYRQLLLSGIKKENIDFYSRCTCCNKDPVFFSYRKDGEVFEGQAAFIALI